MRAIFVACCLSVAFSFDVARWLSFALCSLLRDCPGRWDCDTILSFDVVAKASTFISFRPTFLLVPFLSFDFPSCFQVVAPVFNGAGLGSSLLNWLWCCCISVKDAAALACPTVTALFCW